MESFLIMVFHLFIGHSIMLFILRSVKMLEQVTICFILVELSTKIINLKRAFAFSVIGCAIAIAIVVVIRLIVGNNGFLQEEGIIWTIISGL